MRPWNACAGGRGRARPLPVRARDWLDMHEPATGRLEWVPALAETACDSSLAVTLGNWNYTAKDSMAADTGNI